MTQYGIIKGSRPRQDPVDKKWCYTGKTCARAGVEPGKVYETKDAANEDVKKLTKLNPVGFFTIDLI